MFESLFPKCSMIDYHDIIDNRKSGMLFRLGCPVSRPKDLKLLFISQRSIVAKTVGKVAKFIPKPR